MFLKIWSPANSLQLAEKHILVVKCMKLLLNQGRLHCQDSDHRGMHSAMISKDRFSQLSQEMLASSLSKESNFSSK